MTGQETALAAAGLIADRLAEPKAVNDLRLTQGWWPQSLAHGALGVALLHAERARAGLGPWTRVQDWLSCAAAGGVVGGPDAHLFYGAPALAFVMQAAADRSGQYARALATLDQQLAEIIQGRLASAQQRIDEGVELPALAEFDTIRGLSGLGALLLYRGSHTPLLREVLSYLVRLVEPVKHEADTLPGWWSHLAPSGKPSENFSGGHCNHGVAHGIGGPLALLSLTALHGVTVPGQTDAIEDILRWLDQWQQGRSPLDAWWPYWITRGDLHTGRCGPGPTRPSWCYGTGGLARVVQLAALALGDANRQMAAEAALLAALTSPAQLEATTDLSLCHGFAGLVHLARLTDAEALIPGVDTCLPRLLEPITGGGPEQLADMLLAPDEADIGLLEGAAGIGLALHGFATGGPTASGWDCCFLIC